MNDELVIIKEEINLIAQLILFESSLLFLTQRLVNSYIFMSKTAKPRFCSSCCQYTY